jgi:hypothetical protein
MEESYPAIVTLALGGCPYCGGDFDLYREDAYVLRCSSCCRYVDAVRLSVYLHV